MKSRQFILYLALIFTILLAACGKTAVPTAPPTAQVPTVTPTAAGIVLGLQQRSEAGGYAFYTIPGFSIQTDREATIMVAPGGNVDEGPAIFMLGTADPGTEAMTPMEILELFSQTIPFLTDNKQEVTIKGLAGATGDLVGMPENAHLMGRIGVIVPEAGQYFLVMGVSDEPRWEELAPYFDAVLNTTEFFAPAAATPAESPVPAALGIPEGYESYLSVNLMSPIQDAINILGEPYQKLEEHGYRGYLLQSTIYRFLVEETEIELIADRTGNVVYKAIKTIPEGTLPTAEQLEQVEAGMTLAEVNAILGSGYLLTEFVSEKDTSLRYSVHAYPGAAGEGQASVLFLEDDVVNKIMDLPGVDPLPYTDTIHPRIPLLLYPPTNSYQTVVLGNPDYNKFVNIPLGSTLAEIKAVLGEPSRELKSSDTAAIKSTTYIYNSATAGEFGFKIKEPDPNGLLLQDKDGQLIHKYASYLKEDSNLRTRHILQVKKGMSLEQITRIMGGEGRIYENKYDDNGQELISYIWACTQYSSTVSAVFKAGETTAMTINSSAQDDRYELNSRYEDYILILPAD